MSPTSSLRATLATLTISTGIVLSSGLAVPTKAYVVIDNFETGTKAFAAATKASKARTPRATGVIAEDQNGAGRLREDYELAYSGARSKGSKQGKQSRRRSANDMLLRHLSNKKASSGGGSGSGRGGRRRARRDPRSGDNTDQGTGGHTVQRLVDIHSNSPVGQGRPGRSPLSTDLSLYNGGADRGPRPRAPKGPLAGGPGSPGGGGSGPGNSGGMPPQVDGPHPGPVVSGTPEPAALVVWAVAGCCGYGLLRCRNQWLSVE